jgi:hypothetical protein
MEEWSDMRLSYKEWSQDMKELILLMRLNVFIMGECILLRSNNE